MPITMMYAGDLIGQLQGLNPDLHVSTRLISAEEHP